jgi:hypothetical protein
VSDALRRASRRDLSGVDISEVRLA